MFYIPFRLGGVDLRLQFLEEVVDLKGVWNVTKYLWKVKQDKVSYVLLTSLTSVFTMNTLLSLYFTLNKQIWAN